MRKESNYTRYFLFWRVNPNQKDYQTLTMAVAKINCFIVYRLVRDGQRVVLKGFIILGGMQTHSSATRLHYHFPNFMLYRMGRKFVVEMKDIPDDAVLLGKHPYGTLKKQLFPENSLKMFFGDK